ncbi:hypothetical protein M0R72_04595 [Candidatus Pacearchaeota archaeon]|jgi:hypothetical protein|nr:hypothetical protein [Candidatus Pacearchaeota archaeon]
MNTYNNPITEFENLVKQYPGVNYSVESREGKELESMLFTLLDLKGLSPEEEQQREFIANKIVTNKLRNYIA